jgi:hypothetical protein
MNLNTNIGLFPHRSAAGASSDARRKELMFAGGGHCDKQLVAAAGHRPVAPPLRMAPSPRKILAPKALAKVDFH